MTQKKRESEGKKVEGRKAKSDGRRYLFVKYEMEESQTLSRFASCYDTHSTGLPADTVIKTFWGGEGLPLPGADHILRQTCDTPYPLTYFTNLADQTFFGKTNHLTVIYLRNTNISGAEPLLGAQDIRVGLEPDIRGDLNSAETNASCNVILHGLLKQCVLKGV